MIPWFQPELGEEEKEAVCRIIDSGYINDGEEVTRFEERITAITKTKYCVAVSSGTAAIALALLASGIERGDVVLVPDFTFIATANAVKLAGAIPVLCPISPHNLTINPYALPIANTAKAIIAVDVNGRSCDYTALAKTGLKIICDSTEALGSQGVGRPLGSFGVAGCFSFSANKLVTTGQGGAIVTNDVEIARRARALKNQGVEGKGTGGDDLHPTVGFNFKFTNLQAAIGLVQIARMQKRLERMASRHKLYKAMLGDLEMVRFPKTEFDEFLLWEDVLFTDRGAVERALKRADIGFRNFWHPLSTQAPYRTNVMGTRHISESGMWLPSCFSITDGQIEKVASIIRNAFLR